mmetsp:Transcript_26394/g.34369  ORF Transcript_26394/g.34369 Transcript_26394/m.34369 type:complete len:334 (+) Transcript_26394:26-1027(+)|eukprot:CAMPEP_0195269442 /NCGR_PEP_ID=MMETSP0706-20130129/13775_1 /TAXON_ID=33640 /ORGANISM="Asterionellopsis glacialis, Strain CCMP134" /LENGTH=333 /DNA_ID=CAMNT_0040324559 /DNA_START=15 /DNA_END=1016 /DNA_ORIENTATION=-
MGLFRRKKNKVKEAAKEQASVAAKSTATAADKAKKKKKAPFPPPPAAVSTPVPPPKVVKKLEPPPEIVEVTKKEERTSTADQKTTPVTENKKSAPPQKGKAVKMKPSWLARRQFFTKMADNAFVLIDSDNSGEVDEKELYSGMLLIHLKLGMYAGPAACKPVDHDRVVKVFHTMDVDGSGSLDKDEFREVMMILFSNVLLRVVVQWSMTLIIVPLVAGKILDGIAALWHLGVTSIQNLDERSVIFDAIELFVEDTRDKVYNAMPDAITTGYDKITDLLASVPPTVWETIPLTLLSCILSMLAVPWLIFNIDEFFAKHADKKKDEKEVVDPAEK